jgi:hypothetical protein
MSLRSIPIGSNGYSAKCISDWQTDVQSTLVVDRYLVDRNKTDLNKTDQYKAGFKKAIISHSQFKRNPPFSKDECSVDPRGQSMHSKITP